jgi:hypothetical protein
VLEGFDGCEGLKGREFMIRVYVLTMAAVIAGYAASGDLGPAGAKADRVWFAILAVSPIQPGGKIAIDFQFDAPAELRGTRAPETRLQVRDGEKLQVVLERPLHFFREWTIPGGGVGTFLLTDAAKEDFARLDEGAYFLAVICDGVRSSNVTELIISREFELANEPVLELVPVEPPPYRELPHLGVRLNCIERTEIYWSLKGIVADEVYRRRPVSMGDARSTYSPGDRAVRILDIDFGLVPRIERGKVHEYTLTFGGFDPLTIVAAPDRPLGEAWDAAMQREGRE